MAAHCLAFQLSVSVSLFHLSWLTSLAHLFLQTSRKYQGPDKHLGCFFFFFFATHSCLGGFGSASPVAYMITSGNPIKCGTNQKTSPHALCNLTFLLTYCTTKLGAVAIRSSILYIAVPYISPIKKKKKIGDCHCIAAFPESPKVLHYTTCCRFSIKRFSFVFFSAFSEMFLIVI